MSLSFIAFSQRHVFTQFIFYSVNNPLTCYKTLQIFNEYNFYVCVIFYSFMRFCVTDHLKVMINFLECLAKSYQQ